MDDSFLNNSLLDLDIQEENCVNPDIACGFKIHEQPPQPQSDSVMFGKISLKRFSGYPTEDAERFGRAGIHFFSRIFFFMHFERHFSF